MRVFSKWIIRLIAAFPLIPLLSACGGGSSTTALVANTPVLTGLSVTPVDPIIESGAAIQLTATGTFSDNSTADLTGQVTWRSTAPGVATVSVSGLVNATGVGSATITATDSSSLSASTNLGVQGYTIQGTISVEPGSTVDSDINDPNAPYAANDSPAHAQPLRNPAAAGGYVNQPGTGEDGRSFLAGDRSDFFRVSLLAGQSVAINLSGTDVSGGIDLDLFAYNDDGDIDLNNPDFASVGANSSESITVPSEGIYFIEVFATAGASNYALITGQAVQSTQASLGMDQDFVPGEALVQFANEQPAPGRGDAMTIVAASGAGTRREGRPQRVDVTGMMRERGSSRSASAVDSTPNERLDALYRDNAVQYRKWETLHAIKFLCKRSDVLYAEPNYLRKPQAIPDDSFYGLQWHYPLVNLPQAWETTTGNPNAIVAVIDTGVVLGHPDLQGQLVAGYDFISSASNALDGDGIDPDPDDPGDQSNPDGSSSFHGTHVTGTVAAATDNNIGVACAWRIAGVTVIGVLHSL